MTRDRREQLARMKEGSAREKDQRTDPNEESKDAAHIIEVMRREEDFPQRMQTRHSQKGNHSNIYHDMPVATIDDDYFEMMKREDRTVLQ